MEGLLPLLIIVLFLVVPALLKRYASKAEQGEAEEKPEYRASLNEVRRFLQELGVREEEERPEGPRPTHPQAEVLAPKPAEPSLIEEGREPKSRPRSLVERPQRPAPQAKPLPGLEPVPRPEVRPPEAREPLPLLETVSERKPLIPEAPRPERVGIRRRVSAPPRWARKAAPPPVQKEVLRGLKILPVTLADLPRAVVMAEVLSRPRGFSPYRPYVPPWHRGAEKK